MTEVVLATDGSGLPSLCMQQLQLRAQVQQLLPGAPSPVPPPPPSPPAPSAGPHRAQTREAHTAAAGARSVLPCRGPRHGLRGAKHRVQFQQKLVPLHGDQSTSGPRPAGHVPISKSTGLVVAVPRVGLQQEGSRPRIRGWTTDLDS
jgi:hypothetical protein